MSDFVNIRGNANTGLRKFSMAVLVTLPMSVWYEIPFPVGLGATIILFLSIFTISTNFLKANVLPMSFWLVVLYVCTMRIYHYYNTIGIGAAFPPGGWKFFIFCVAIIWGTMTFDMRLLRKYMCWIVWISMILFWIQVFFIIVNGSLNICFVPNLTGSFIYEGMNYQELVSKQFSDVRACSIFLEPSYMAYYFMTYLAIIWFSQSQKNRWINMEVFLIILTLLVLKSGSGLVALAAMVIIKFFYIFRHSKLGQRIRILLITLPLLFGAIYSYSTSDIGQEMLSRTDEFSTEGSSGFTRVLGGIFMFEQMTPNERLIGIGNPEDTFGTLREDGTVEFYANGFQTILISLGYIGLSLYLFFYGFLFKNASISGKICIVILLILSLLESNYLNAYMMLLTIIPCSELYWKRKFLGATKIKRHLTQVKLMI